MPVIPLECPSCGTESMIDSDESAAICSYCGKPFVIKDAIVQNYIRIVTDARYNTVKALAFDEFVVDGDVLQRYNGASPEIVIPGNVAVIGDRAFEDNKEISSIRMSGSVKEIGENAFSGCDNLRTVIFPDSLKKIGSYAFSECTGLISADLPSSLEEIGPYAFTGCFMLGAVKMPSSRTKVHETAFMGSNGVSFEWPDDWSDRQFDKLRIAATVQGGMISLFGPEEKDDTFSEPLLFMGISDLGMYVESNKYNFYTYRDFMRQFSLGANNNDPYLLRVSVDTARQRYEAVADIQKCYSELITLLDRAKISRSRIGTINIPHFIWKQGKGLNDYKITDIGPVQVLQVKIIQKKPSCVRTAG